MRKRTRIGVILAAIMVAAGGAWGEVVEEETWFGASGEVVKIVKRTYTGVDVPVAQSSWEPSWVIRDREKAQRRSGNSTRYRRYGSRYARYGYSYYRPVYYRVPYHCGRRGGSSGRTTGWRGSAGHGRLLIGYSD